MYNFCIACTFQTRVQWSEIQIIVNDDNTKAGQFKGNMSAYPAEPLWNTTFKSTVQKSSF